jgi:hypothetical protein
LLLEEEAAAAVLAEVAGQAEFCLEKITLLPLEQPFLLPWAVAALGVVRV